ncbi:ferritin-like domain-containing protein [Desulfurococcus mucosus]|uniref:ferritin-like domain-containing protein n=1 Tax=Desulfurococcus mucosus TaxID=2275 RepID=UPI00064F8B3C|nr:ferritin-like domain-containing protein [Desulfurococcus mucosus]
MSREIDAGRLLEYSRIEEDYARRLSNLGESLKHPVLRALFKSIARDSEKHAMIYRALADLLTSPQPFITEDELERVKAEVSHHIETEKEMLRTVEEMLKTVEDPRVKLLLAAIRDDEAEHHALLVSIREKIASAETLTEQKLWDMIWKDSPWHGTPGG